MTLRSLSSGVRGNPDNSMASDDYGGGPDTIRVQGMKRYRVHGKEGITNQEIKINMIGLELSSGHAPHWLTAAQQVLGRDDRRNDAARFFSLDRAKSGLLEMNEYSFIYVRVRAGTLPPNTTQWKKDN
ncbi:MAG: hypothetical protein JEZ11_11635 [Desulfobacterales bacterium]|nr:hypothetical protein [Desulfobacterales bacterium]